MRDESSLIEKARRAARSMRMKTLPLTREEANAFDRSDETLGRSWAERLLRFTEISHLRACAILLVVALFCFLPGIHTLQPMDPSEARFAQSSKQMLETRDFIDIRFREQARHERPIGIHWLQSASVAAAEALGHPDARSTIAFYRIPSLVGALAAILLTYWAALALASRREAFLAAAFLAASALLMVEARLATTSALLLACIVAAMGGLARAYLARGAERLPTPTVVLFWCAVAIGILSEGPVILLFVGLAVAALAVRERSLYWLVTLRPLLGLAIVVAICAPWLLAVSWQTDGEFLAAYLSHTFGLQHAGPWAPPGAYLLFFFVAFWPIAIMTCMAVPFAWINRGADVICFLVAWTLPAWIALELWPVKLPHYVMPLYPALAILTALALTRGFVGPHRSLGKLSSLLLMLVPIGLSIGLPLVAQHLGDRLAIVGMPLVVASAIASLFAWILFVRRAAIAAALTGILAAMILSVGAFGFFQPLLRSVQISERLAAATEAIGCPASQIATLGFEAPSLVFLIGTDLGRFGSGSEAAGFLSGAGCRVLLVERRLQREFLDALDESAAAPALLTRVSGFELGKARRVDIGVYVTGR